MIKRRLVKLGKSSLVISLPKDWLRNLKLNAGDELGIVVEKDGALRILPPKLLVQSKTSPIVISVERCDQPKILERALIAAYVVGRDPIIIENKNGFDASQLEETRRVIDKIRGLEIVKESPNHIVLRTFLDPTRYPLAGLLRRLTSLIQTMIEYLLTALREKNKNYLQEIIYIEEEIDRIYFSALRQIFLAHKNEDIAESIGVKSASELLSLRMAVKMFELLADTLADLADKGLKLGSLVFEGVMNNKELVNMLSDMNMAIDTITKTLIYGNISLTNDLLNRIENIRQRSERIEMTILPRKNMDPDLACWLREVSWRMAVMLDAIRVVAELAINISIDKTEKRFEC